ncbi:MAG TPA: saccharopine dehydrogenase NADP-binding domain-containing protein [Pseudonocardiaceae bacterium]|nr:saccharopine dehydrogenase NADP-binding domain-containing protein [Pseudonocardiaceae bacterium]
MIVLFGATGYTGRRVAQSMVRRGLRPVLAGRDAGRLSAVASRLDNLEVARADVTDTASVRALIRRGGVLVSTVGPFIRLGEPALRAAIEAGAIYLDSTGESPFIRRVFEEFGPAAQRTGASLITAFGHDYVPGNLAGALALRDSRSKVHRIEVAYLISGVGRSQVISRGTFRSAVGLLTERDFTWRDGIRPQPAGVRARIIQVGGREYPAVALGTTEHYALPQLAGPVGLAAVDVYFGRCTPVTPMVRLGCRVIPALLASSAVRSMVRGIGTWAQRWVAEEPDASALARVNSHIVATAYDESGAELAQVRLVSGDPYQLTADLLAWGAQQAAEHGVSGPGALGPAAAFGLDPLAAGAHEVGLRHAIEDGN